MNDEIRMANEELPSGWCWSCAEVLKKSNRHSLAIGPFGSNLKVIDYRDEGVPLVFVREIRARDFGGSKTKFVTPKKAQELNAHSISGGDLLITKMGDPPGDVAIYPLNAPNAIITADCIKLSADPKQAHTMFLAYAIECPQTRSRIEEITAGVAQQKISLQRFRNFPLPLAPLAEQKRIADKLESVLGRVDACRARLDRVPALLKRFRQSVLAAATSGKLTEEWRMTNGVNDEWEEKKLTELGELGRGKSKHRPRNDKSLYGGEYPFVQTGDVAKSGGYILQHSQTYSEFGLAQSKLWPAQTVCITIAANIADTAILSYPACFPDSVVGFIANAHECRPEFIKWTIDVIKQDLEAFAPATAQKNINLGVLYEIRISCPTLSEQQEIVRRVEALFALADRIEARLAVVRKTADRLTPSVLAKAFRGELVPQDPNDEPASVLLERLQSQAAPQPARAPRKKRASKASVLAD